MADQGRRRTSRRQVPGDARGRDRERGVRTPVVVAEGRQRSVWAVVLLAVAVAVGIGTLAALHQASQVTVDEHTDSRIFTDRVAVVGVTDRVAPSVTDEQVLSDRAAQVGAVVGPPRCAASAWASLSAGRAVTIDCAAAVSDNGFVLEWQRRQAEARRGGGELGALAGDASDCVSSVGPGAALGAVRPDGSLADQREVGRWIADDYPSACPVTLVDAGVRSDEVVAALAGRDDWTVIVVGMGGEHRAQLIYRLGTTLSGWLTAPDQGRPGVVTPDDLARTVGDHLSGTAWTGAAGLPLQVVENSGVPIGTLAAHVQRLDTWISVPWPALAVLGVLVAAAGTVIALLWRRGHPEAARVSTLLLVLLPAGLLLAGGLGWWRTSAPMASLVTSVILAWAGLTVLVRVLGRRIRVGTAAVATTYLVFLLDAALGGVLFRTSLLAARPLTRFDGVGGPGLGFLVASACATVIAIWRITTTDARRDWWRPAQGDSPWQTLWRPTAGAAVVVSLILGLSWGFAGIGLGGVLAAVAAIGWVALTTWLLRHYRADRRTRRRVLPGDRSDPVRRVG